MFGSNRKSIPANEGPASPADAFLGCPNRNVTRSTYGDELELTCVRYEIPTPLNFTKITNEATRDQIAQQLGCMGCNYNSVDYKEVKRSDLMERLHPSITEECGELYENEHYSEAAIKGFMTVKERLRELTGYESSTDAFGKGGLHINGASAEHVNPDYQQAAKFLLMSIDMFRNEGVHSKFGSASGSQRSYEFLTLSSLAMNLLESTEQPEDPTF